MRKDLKQNPTHHLQNQTGCLPVSYTHLDVYKRQVYGVRFNDLGAKGRLSFRINDRMKINMFGTYSVYNGYGMTPASQLFMNQNSYGGTLEFKISDSFGIEAGAEREFNPMTRKWETHPIIMPVFY